MGLEALREIRGHAEETQLLGLAHDVVDPGYSFAGMVFRGQMRQAPIEALAAPEAAVAR
jgi:hypothetical protein